MNFDKRFSFLIFLPCMFSFKRSHVHIVKFRLHNEKGKFFLKKTGLHLNKTT